MDNQLKHDLLKLLYLSYKNCNNKDDVKNYCFKEEQLLLLLNSDKDSINRVLEVLCGLDEVKCVPLKNCSIYHILHKGSSAYCDSKYLKLKTQYEMQEYDFLYKKFVWKWRWTPWIISALALVVAIASYFKPEKMQQEKTQEQLQKTQVVHKTPLPLLNNNQKKDTVKNK